MECKLTSYVTGQMVQLLRQETQWLGLSQAEIARRLGVSQKHISCVVNGKTRARNELLEDWAKELGMKFRVTWRSA